MLSHRVAIIFSVTLCLAQAPESVSGQNAAMGPGYSRMRMGAADGNARSAGQNWGRYNGGYGYGYGIYPPYYFSPVIAGPWYSRPYPYHFDYYRWRWGGNQPNNVSRAELQGPPNCPCEIEAAHADPPRTQPSPAEGRPNR